MSTKDIANNGVITPIDALKNKSHLFQKGHAPFKPKGITELRQMARGMAPHMLQVMIDIALDTDERGSVRLAAADMVMTRGYGKAESYHDKDERGAIANASELTSGEILALMQQVQTTADPADLEPKVEDTLSLENSEQLQIAQELKD